MKKLSYKKTKISEVFFKLSFVRSAQGARCGIQRKFGRQEGNLQVL
jgi:hypothetical protein